MAVRKREPYRKLVLSSFDRRKLGLIAELTSQLCNHRLSSKLNLTKLILGSPTVTNRTVRNYLARLAITRKKSSCKPFLTPRHIRNRLEFCKKYRNHDLSKTIYSDKASFAMFSSTSHSLNTRQLRPTERFWAHL